MKGVRAASRESWGVSTLSRDRASAGCCTTAEAYFSALSARSPGVHFVSVCALIAECDPHCMSDRLTTSPHIGFGRAYLPSPVVNFAIAT